MVSTLSKDSAFPCLVRDTWREGLCCVSTEDRQTGSVLTWFFSPPLPSLPTSDTLCLGLCAGRTAGGRGPAAQRGRAESGGTLSGKVSFVCLL